MKKYALIVAGGSGTRMQTDIPKQFLLLAGKPILMHTIAQFEKYSKENLAIILVLPQEQISFWGELCKKHQFNTPHTIIEGGKSRYQSVKNGLNSIKIEENFDENAVNSDAIVAIHDGVRPLVSVEVIAQGFEMAKNKGNAVVCVPLKDSIRQVNTVNNSSQAVNRADFRLIQTPQTFQLSQIKKAYLLPETPEFTDDSSIAEKAGFKIHLLEGNYQNIKITTPEDLVFAETLFLKCEV
jgi:2-C-methyl-D-erythritol 4-phosphate cytidylyltransferase